MAKTTFQALYPGVDFYAERTRAGSSNLAGSVLVVSPKIRNGACFAAIGVPRGARTGRDALPVVTWVSPAYLATKCVKVSEQEARSIDAATLAAIDAFERSPEYRAMWAAEIAKPGRTTLQNAHASGDWVGKKFYELYGA